MPTTPEKLRIVFVCMGNICRSPTAEGVMRALVERAGLAQHYELDSAGTHAYHLGNPPDPRSLKAAALRGYDFSALRARQICADDFMRFDLVLAMDRDNLAQLQRACPPELRNKLGLFLDYAEECDDDEVPDPYYDGPEGFERVLDLAEAAAQGLIERTQRNMLWK
ncbi:MAG: low molecular weight phosphotyrosine protein phosphatase [Proteobacteria bacterium]|nr:low molecular weight phosphotyrosine protein phosphatase [Pseudomonadota bacterium]